MSKQQLEKLSQNGLIKLEDREYFAIDAISASLLKRVYNKEFYEVLNKVENSKNDAMKFGSLVHCMVLEPDEFNNRYAVMQELNLRTKEGKESKNLFELENRDKEIVTQDELRRAQNCLKSLENAKLLKIFKRGLKEQVALFKMQDLNCKSKIDFYDEKNGLLIDLKTTSKSGEEFLKDCKKFHYNLQMAFYHDGLVQLGKEIKKVLIVGIQNQKPFKITIAELEQDELEVGRDKYNLAIKMLNKIKSDNKYKSELETNILGSNIFKLQSSNFELQEIEKLKQILGEINE